MHLQPKEKNNFFYLVGITSSTIGALVDTGAGELASGSMVVAGGRGAFFFFTPGGFPGAGVDGLRGGFLLFWLVAGAQEMVAGGEEMDTAAASSPLATQGTAGEATPAGLGGGANPRQRSALGLAGTVARSRGGGSAPAPGACGRSPMASMAAPATGDGGGVVAGTGRKFPRAVVASFRGVFSCIQSGLFALQIYRGKGGKIASFVKFWGWGPHIQRLLEHHF